MLRSLVAGHSHLSSFFSRWAIKTTPIPSHEIVDIVGRKRFRNPFLLIMIPHQYPAISCYKSQQMNQSMVPTIFPIVLHEFRHGIPWHRIASQGPRTQRWGFRTPWAAAQWTPELLPKKPLTRLKRNGQYIELYRNMNFFETNIVSLNIVSFWSASLK